jgi:sugar/nucleoside kinase (ribokinase family)
MKYFLQDWEGGMRDVITIGEALIDFLSVEKGVLIEQTTGFTFAPGGAPANVAAAISKLGGRSGFIGKVGRDSFGRLIKKTLEDAGVDLDLFTMDGSVNTTLAFISIKKNDEPDYTFYRNRCGADIALKQDELDEGYISETRIFHFGSLSFTHEPLRGTVNRAVHTARTAGRVISFDPNLRPSLWDDMDRARREIINGMEIADVVKLTEEELDFVTGTDNLQRGTDSLMKYGPRLVIVTRGADPSFFNNGDISFETPSFEVEFVEATGAGDAFVGGVLLQLARRVESGLPVFALEREEADDLMRFAHAAGALTVTRKGVIPALPTLREVEEFLGSR